MGYALVTPARDEAANLAVLAPTVIAQSLKPATWVIVDDGSSDGTGELAARLAAEHYWITVVHSGRDAGAVARGRREGRALLSLQAGVRALPCSAETVTKLDADVALRPDYFERLLPAFAADPRLGLASGERCELERGVWRRRHLTGTAVEAQCRTYRWACWEDVQPMEPRMGWDGIDEARAVTRGWRTLVVDGLEFWHRRTMGERDGSRVRARTAEGLAAHFMGYRPSYLVLRALWQARREPAALAMLWGYLYGVAGGEGRCLDAAAVAHIRRQQSARRLSAVYNEARGRSRN